MTSVASADKEYEYLCVNVLVVAIFLFCLAAYRDIRSVVFVSVVVD